MIDALSHCHEKGISHRDMKAENIFVDQDYNIKIGDFGFAASNGEKADRDGLF